MTPQYACETLFRLCSKQEPKCLKNSPNRCPWAEQKPLDFRAPPRRLSRRRDCSHAHLLLLFPTRLEAGSELASVSMSMSRCRYNFRLSFPPQSWWRCTALHCTALPSFSFFRSFSSKFFFFSCFLWWFFTRKQKSLDFHFNCC